MDANRFDVVVTLRRIAGRPLPLELNEVLRARGVTAVELMQLLNEGTLHLGRRLGLQAARQLAQQLETGATAVKVVEVAPEGAKAHRAIGDVSEISGLQEISDVGEISGLREISDVGE